MSRHTYLKNKQSKGKITYKFFNFSNYPSHFSIANNTWKQIMIYDSLLLYKTIIFWFDGGVEITGNLDYEVRLAKETGMYIEPSMYATNIFLPSIVAEYFSVKRQDLKNYTTINIALIAVKYSKKIIKNVIIDMIKLHCF